MFPNRNITSDYQIIGYYYVLVDKETLIREFSEYKGYGNFLFRGYDENGKFYEHFFDSQHLLQ